MEALTCHNMALILLIFRICRSEMEVFGTILNSFHFLIFATKNSILDIASVLDLTLITDTFSLHSWILIDLKPILAYNRNWPISSNGKEDG